MSTHPTSITPLHREISVSTERRTPTVADNPLLTSRLAHNRHRMVERLLRTVPKSSVLLLTIIRELARSHHRCHHVPLTDFILNSHTILLWKHPVTPNLVFFYLRVIDHILTTGKRVPSLRSIRVVFLSHQSDPHHILKPLRDIAVRTPINQIVIVRTVNQLLLG